MQVDGFEIEVNAPYSLNYMVFLQNVYLNQNRYQEGRLVFPFVDSSKWGLLGNVQFVDAFKEVWETLLQKNLNKRFDHNGILTDEKALFQRLFQGTAAGVFGFEESSKAFLVWWISFAGKIAVERVFDGDSMTKLYKELAGSVKTTRENNRLNIALLYDRLVLCGSFQRSWYLTLPIEDVFLINRRPELLELMRNSCN